MAGNPFDEYTLIRAGVITQGAIINAKEYLYLVEVNNREKTVPMYDLDYAFKDSKGILFNSTYTGGGHLPERFPKLPFPVEIEYYCCPR